MSLQSNKHLIFYKCPATKNQSTQAKVCEGFYSSALQRISILHCSTISSRNPNLSPSDHKMPSVTQHAALYQSITTDRPVAVVYSVIINCKVEFLSKPPWWCEQQKPTDGSAEIIHPRIVHSWYQTTASWQHWHKIKFDSSTKWRWNRWKMTFVAHPEGNGRVAFPMRVTWVACSLALGVTGWQVGITPGLVSITQT